MAGLLARLRAEDREHRHAMAVWQARAAELPERPQADGLTICSVGYRGRICLEQQTRLLEALNPGAAVPWLVFDNNTEPSERIARDGPFTVISGDREGVLGYEHALAMSRLLAHVRTRFVLFLDPDCFIVRPDWVARVPRHMIDHQLGFFGTPINPRRHNSYRYFPYMVCMFVDLARVPPRHLCFVPDVWDFRVSLGYRVRNAITRLPKAGYLWRWLLTEQWRTNGWRIKARYGSGADVRFECAQPVWDVDDAIPRGSLKRLVHTLTPASVSPIPKLKDYCSPVGFSAMGAPDVARLGWEEFVWERQPFAFHVGSVHGKPGQYEAQLDQVVSHWDAETSGARVVAAHRHERNA